MSNPTLTLFVFLLPNCTRAVAGGYTAEDLGRAVQQGLPTEAVEAIAASVGPLDADAVTTLLRYGVDPDWIRAHTEGAHTSPVETAAASAMAGPAAPPPRDLSELSDADWDMLAGTDVVVRTPSGIVAGRLEGLASDGLILAAVAGKKVIAVADVMAIRCADGSVILGYLGGPLVAAPPPSPPAPAATEGWSPDAWVVTPRVVLGGGLVGGADVGGFAGLRAELAASGWRVGLEAEAYVGQWESTTSSSACFLCLDGNTRTSSSSDRQGVLALLRGSRRVGQISGGRGVNLTVAAGASQYDFESTFSTCTSSHANADAWTWLTSDTTVSCSSGADSGKGVAPTVEVSIGYEFLRRHMEGSLRLRYQEDAVALTVDIAGGLLVHATPRVGPIGEPDR